MNVDINTLLLIFVEILRIGKKNNGIRKPRDNINIYEILSNLDFFNKVSLGFISMFYLTSFEVQLISKQ